MNYRPLIGLVLGISSGCYEQHLFQPTFCYERNGIVAREEGEDIVYRLFSPRNIADDLKALGCDRLVRPAPDNIARKMAEVEKEMQAQRRF